MTKANGPLFKISFRRRREGVTDYAKRLAFLKSGAPRAVVRKSNKFVLVQVTEYSPQGDKVIAQASSRELSKYGFEGKCNTPSAYLAGMLAAKKALAKGAKRAVADLGRQTAVLNGVLFAAVAGLNDAGLETPLGEEAKPAAERVAGGHLKLDKQKFEQARDRIASGRVISG